MLYTRKYITVIVGPQRVAHLFAFTLKLSFTISNIFMTISTEFVIHFFFCSAPGITPVSKPRYAQQYIALSQCINRVAIATNCGNWK